MKAIIFSILMTLSCICVAGIIVTIGYSNYHIIFKTILIIFSCFSIFGIWLLLEEVI
jgi:hypothetical protein